MLQRSAIKVDMFDLLAFPGVEQVKVTVACFQQERVGERVVFVSTALFCLKLVVTDDSQEQA